MYARFLRRLLPVLAVLLPVALVSQSTQASASSAAMTIELRSSTAHAVSYSYSPSGVETYLATVEGAVNGIDIDPTTCTATLGSGGTTAPRASLGDCAGFTITASLAGPGTDRAAVTVASEGRPIAYAEGTVVVTTEPDPDNPAAIIVIILIIVFVLIPLAAH